MRILVDTNILIQLEDNKVIENDFSIFYNLAVSNKCEIYYHNACLRDIAKDKNQVRKEIITSKFAKYSVLPNPAPFDNEFSKSIGEKNDNDRIDNIQLYQLVKGYVELFVTNDKNIKKKAKKLGILDSVLNSNEAFNLLDEKFTLKIPTHPIIDHVSVRELESDFESDFFVSLKNDYDPEKFMKWIDKCAKEDRKCYRLKIDEKLAALLIYNRENVGDHRLDGINQDVIKICTLKVADDALGMKLGELFLNKMFQLCRAQKLDYLYITTYDKQDALIYLLEKFGFDRYSEFRNNVNQNEIVFLKDLSFDGQRGKSGNLLHPYFRDCVNKYIIPIQPNYYKSLFKDSNLREPEIFDDEDYGLQEVQGNTIIKAYISNSPRLDLRSGDLLFFYSSRRYKSIEPLGVLLEHRRVDNFEDLWEMVRSKTVYSPDKLRSWLATRKYLTVSTFRLVQYLDPVMDFRVIKRLKSFSNKFQTITKMNDSDYFQIKNDYIDESFIVD